MRRVLVFAYGLVVYILFLGIFVYLIGFVGNLGVPRSIDAPLRGSWGAALAVNTLLLALFGLQHSGMARPGFKRWWTRTVPEPIERSTYVLCTNLVLLLLVWQWRPITAPLWELHVPAARALLWGVFGAGWLLVLVSTFLINHFDLFGLRQVYRHLRGRSCEPLGFLTPGLYRYVRHPLYLGFLLALWATPSMTVGHAFFALGMTLYILVAVGFEERDLVEFLGPAYAEYRQRVPMLLPRLFR